MWETISQIGSGLTLVAFVVAAAVTYLRRRLVAKEQQLVEAPDADKLTVIQALNDSFIVPALPVDPSRLSREQQYTLLLEQIRDRSRRFYVTSVVILILAIVAAALTALALMRAQTPPANKQVDKPATTKPTQQNGVFRRVSQVHRNGEALWLDLGEADVVDAVRAFAAMFKQSIVLDPDVRGKVRVKFDGAPWPVALEMLAAQVNAVAVIDNKLIRIAPLDRLTREARSPLRRPNDPCNADLLSVELKEAPLGDVVHTLGEICGWNITIDSAVTGTVTLFAHNAPPDVLLDIVCRGNGAAMTRSANVIRVASIDVLEREQRLLEPGG